MSFAHFGLPVTMAGMIALAGIVYLLQRLRPERRVLRLPTAALWAQAMRDTPARVLGGRFRYWLAYLLILTITLLLWLAASHPQVDPAAAGGRMQIFYLDNSAALTGGSDLARARRALLADVRATPADRRQVVLGDAIGTRLLAAGESVSLLSRRLDMVSAQARPSTFASWLTRVGRGQAGIRYYGSWGVARSAVAEARPTVPLRYGYLADPVPDNRGITALGVTPAASGRVGKADALVTVLAAHGPAPTASALRWTMDGRGFTPARVETLGDGRFVARDVDATGGTLGVALARGDGFAADDQARLRLADRRPLRVALLDGTPLVIRAVVAADPALAVVPGGQAQVVVGSAQGVRGVDRPALILTDPTTQAQAFLFAGPGEADRGGVAPRLATLGLAQLDAAALADALHRPIGVDARDAGRRSVALWADILRPTSPFVESPVMPVFISRSLQWLGGREHWTSFAKAGVPPDPPLASRAEGPVSLTDRATTLAVADMSPRPATPPLGGACPPDGPFLLLLVVAGLLLGVEWWLVQRRVMA